MRNRLMLSALISGVVLLGGVGEAQRSGSFPVIVVFHSQAALDGFAGRYRADARAQADPDGWGYLNRGVGGAVQDLERRQGFSADHVFSHTIRGFSARLTARQIDAI